MFKLHRHKSDRLGERFEFKFSNFRALQVPNGWDKLFLSIVSVDTGKAIAKSSKASTRDGTCLWADSISESISVYQDVVSKEMEECQFKIVVSMGSARTGILGEAIVNLSDYVHSRDPSPLSLPLKKCNYGTVLQLKIQCISPKSKFRDGRSWKETSSRLEESKTNNEDIDSKSDGSDGMFNRSIGSSSSNHLGVAYPDEPGMRNTSFSASGSHRSSDSGDSSLDKTMFSPRNNLNGGGAYMGRQDSAGSNVSATNNALRGDNLSRSNNSSFGSKASGSSTPHENSMQAFANGLSHLSLRPSDSSKDLLEAAEETIEELRDEAKMWERHSRKLKVDLEMLKKESSDKSKIQAELEMELSTARAESNTFKQEIEQLKSSLAKLSLQETSMETPKIEDMINVHKELEDEVKFQKESNANLMLQLEKSQESNIELVSILQELEETIEKQKLEISQLSHDSYLDEGEKGPFHKGSNRSHADLEKENEVLKAKLQELEKDCAELTDENLELLYKMKELNKVTKESEEFCVSESAETEIAVPSSHIHQLGEELRRTEMLHGGIIEPTAIKNLEMKCADLELELQNFRDKTFALEKKLQKSQAKAEERNLELSELRQELESLRRMEFASGDTEVKSWSTSELASILAEMNKEIHVSLTLARNLCYNCDSDTYAESESNIDFIAPISTDIDGQRKQAEAMAKDLFKLNALLRENSPGNWKIQPKTRSIDNCGELEESKCEIDRLKASLLLRENEISSLVQSKTELEGLIYNIQKEKGQLEESLKIARKESSITSKCLDDVRHDLTVLTNTVDTHVATNKMLERKSMELEICKIDLELHISELEQENVQLSERISGLEAQLGYLTDERESNRLELEDSRTLILDLKDKVERQQREMEAQKLEHKEKLQEAQKRLIEAQEESELLRRSNSKLQATAESLIEEFSSLQTITTDLRKKKLELHDHVTHVELELEESQKKNTDFCRKVELLEVKLSSLQKDISSKEKSLLSELESIFQEHKEHEEKITRAHLMLNKMEKEKIVEVENLEREVANLTAQVSSTHDERERIALDAIHEVSSLRSDKAKLESNLLDANTQMKLCETELQTLRQESKNKIQGLVDLLNASKQSEEMLMTDIEHMQRLIEDVKSSEEKFRKTSNELEIKLKTTDYEKRQIIEEISELKAQLQKSAHLQDDIMALKSRLDEAKFEKEKLDELLQSASEECEELRTERVVLMDRVSSMQKALDSGEDNRRSKIALEAKLLRLESDLSAKEASCAHETELKNELSRMKRANSEYQRKMQSLEQEKDEFMRKAQLMEKEVVLKKEQDSDEKVTSEGEDMPPNHTDGSLVKSEANLHLKIQLLEAELAEAREASKMYKSQLESFLSEKRSDNGEILKKAMSENAMKVGNAGKVASLEAELKDMKERYLHMSLQYAEVEAQREELVMKLKTMKKEKRWFSRE
ncbi:myosin-2 heavy chain-like [Ananas comosus]|uniref:Myosin-2 heavy chain-like n=2 Tax=Ananas comosus TaxID=4615 RepID=A0A6P5FD92_ANACO|nr:myosin-2 heavy chain-like [Ananas comosus]